MGFTLRFLLGSFLLLSICSSTKSAATWHRMKLLSQEPSTLQPIDKNTENSNANTSEETRKPKTDETNKIVSEINTKEEDAAENKPAKTASVTENNDLSKESLEFERTVPNPEDLHINIKKYVSSDFHDKNNIYKLPTSPDIEKYVDNESYSRTTSNTDTTSNDDFDKKHQIIQNDIKKNLEYIDDKFPPKTTYHYEQTTDNKTPVNDIIKHKNSSSVTKNANRVHKDVQVETEHKIDYGSSYTHTVFDEQQRLSSSDASLDTALKKNETDDLKNKAFRTKTTADPEVLHEKLNETERHTALLSNKIEHDNTNENRRSKWSLHFTPTTPPYTTTTGQKEEIMFVPYTKENPINISKRGSTKFIDTITTPKAIESKQAKLLDEAAVENQIYPVQVPPPNKISKEESFEETVSPRPKTVGDVHDGNQGAFVTTTTSTLPTYSSQPAITTTRGNEVINSNSVTSGNATKPPELTTSTTDKIEKEQEGTSEASVIPITTEENLSTSTFPVTTDTEFTTTSVDNVTTTPVLKVSKEDAIVVNATTTPAGVTEESTTAVETTTIEGISTTNEYVSEQPTSIKTTIENRTNDSPTTLLKGLEANETESTTPIPSTNLETTTAESGTTSKNTQHIPLSSTEQKNFINIDDDDKSTTPLKIEERTGTSTTSRDLKNLTTVTEHTVANTVDYTDNNVKKHEDITSSTTEDITTKEEPANNVHTPRHPVDVVSHNTFPLPSEAPLDVSGNSRDNTDSAEQEEQESFGGGKIAAIVISCIGALCFIILAILWFVMRKRHKKFNYGQRCTPVSLDAYSVDNVSAHNSVRRKGMMRASKRSYGNPAFEEGSVTHLLNFPELMKFGTNSDRISAEYDDIPQISVQTNELPEGCETKNRYANVIPLPESRVFLSAIDDCRNSDYINANFVMGPKSTRNYYIACQAPMQTTVDDFWRMVWEQQSRVVLMLTHLFENGAEKCFDYLPPSEVLDCHRLFGDFQITLKKREVKEKYVISNLQLKNMVSNTWREVTQLWYLGWPERGVPSEESSLVAFLIEARSYYKAAPSENGKTKEPTAVGMNGISSPEHNPIVVHCSPGTGRTGTVIACDIAIREFELTRQVDIPKTVYQIRRNRAGAVQTKEQYAFIYRVITWYANKLTGGVLDTV